MPDNHQMKLSYKLSALACLFILSFLRNPSVFADDITDGTNNRAILEVTKTLIAPIYLVNSLPAASTETNTISESQAVQIENEFEKAFRISSLEFLSLHSLLQTKPSTEAKNLVISKKLSKQALADFALKQGFDSILLLNVSRYADRSGSAYGSNDLASFAISAHLVNAKTQAEVWSSSYDYSDKAKPLISFEEGKLAKLGFKSAAELIQEAAASIARDFVDFRRKGFIKS